MIVPSIDLMGGRAVQLRRGRDLLLTDPRDPVELAAELGRYGPVAIVDLDAALGRGDNREIARACCRVARCRVGGGIRSVDDARDWIRAGAEKVVVGTLATPEFLGRLPREQTIAAIDARGERIVVEGWTSETEHRVVERARELAPYCGELLFTQVEREGMLAGADFETARALREATDLPLTVAGGITGADEIARLEALGCNSQLGRALYEGRIDLAAAWVAQVRFDDGGLVPTIAQDDASGEVLMLAWSTAESLRRALERGEGWYWSRSRGELWRKGATSGHTQRLVRAAWDCDGDAVLFRVRQRGPACHVGRTSCFDATGTDVLGRLESTIADRAAASGAADSYTRRLLDDPALVAAKLREETAEVIEARERSDVAWEAADLLYHLLVRMRAGGVSLREVEDQLRARFPAGG